MTNLEIFQGILLKDDYQTAINELISVLGSWEGNYMPEMLKSNIDYLTELRQDIIPKLIAETTDYEKKKFLLETDIRVKNEIENMNSGKFHD